MNQNNNLWGIFSEQSLKNELENKNMSFSHMLYVSWFWFVYKAKLNKICISQGPPNI